MKHIATIFSVLILAGTTTLLSCTVSPETKGEKVEKAEQNLVNAEQESDMAKTDPAMAYNTFKAETDRILAANEARMLELKTAMLEKRSDIEAQYEKDLEALKSENEKLKQNVESFKYGTSENWKDFKATVNNDMDKLGKSISALAEKSRIKD